MMCLSWSWIVSLDDEVDRYPKLFYFYFYFFLHREATLFNFLLLPKREAVRHGKYVCMLWPWVSWVQRLGPPLACSVILGTLPPLLCLPLLTQRMIITKVLTPQCCQEG